jgi:type I restriction-modification system DNA methylase subunit
MNTENLRQLFQSEFDYKQYTNEIVHNLFGCNDVAIKPELLDTSAEGDRSHYIGRMEETEGRLLGFFYTRVAEGSDVRRKRVGLRKLIAPYLKYDVDAAIAVFDDGTHWRLSYICDMRDGATAAKRFSYILGDEKGQYKTPLERLDKIASRYGRFKLEDLKDAFSVDSLSDEFFKEYHRHYDIIIDYLAKNANLDVKDSILHDYVKKMMGRIVFLHFLQKKGWLNDDTNYLKNLFFMQPLDRQADFLEKVLEPLFFGIFNTESDNRRELFEKEGWDRELLEQWRELPYLNGGLFERDEVDDMRITLPSKLFEDLFNFMASYNFTVDENDPDDAEIGVDPEMLGKIFESLLEDNKAKGAFYTPKEIVRYMCKESLIAYLCEKVSDNAAEGGNNKQDSQDFESEANRSIRRFVETHELPAELEPCRDALSEALREVKICDPAIGSGAFPMGLLNELWRCREAIEETSSRAALKKEIIENNIYGVDIEKGAIDIARLRFWLSIVVDAEKPEPLPNFDYKFMQGNSLIESFDGHDLSHIMDKEGKPRGRGGYQRSISGQESYQVAFDFSSADTRQNLRLWLKKYFSLTDHREKAEYRQRINESVKEYIKQQGIGAAAEARLAALDPSANQDFFLWHTWFKDIFDNGGFDIVIGNPPYVVLAGEDDLNIQYKRIFLTANDGKTNLYKLFYEQGLKLLTQDGVLSFITPNTYLTGKDSKVLRGLFFKTTSLREIIEYTEKDKVFENVTQAVTTLILTKPAKSDNKVKIRTYKQGSAECNQSDLKNLDVIIPLDNVIQTMNKHKERLTGFFKINQGEVNLSTKKEHYSINRHNGTLPMWRGNNIGKYVPQSLPFEYCEISVSNPEYYSKKRIVMQEVSNQNQPFRTKAIISQENYICGHSTNSLTPLGKEVNLLFFLGLINSKAFNYYCDYFSYTNHITVSGIKQVPIPNSSQDQQNNISDMVNKILQEKNANVNADISAMEHEIDKLVYQLYNLTPEEIAIIEQ